MNDGPTEVTEHISLENRQQMKALAAAAVLLLAHLPVVMPDAQHVAAPPAPVSLAYAGGHVQVAPKVYLVLWGWGAPGAFDHTTPGMPASDPDGVARQMTSFVSAIGSTPWANVSTQYYEAVNGQHIRIQNPVQLLAGVWHDNVDPIHNDLSGLELAKEAQRAVAHFDVTDLSNSQFVIAQPQMYDEAGFNGDAGYCAWHDYTQPTTYPGVKPGISFTNMPYVLDAGARCGGSSGATIVLGHEIEATIADPGAENIVFGQKLGGWYDPATGGEADTCAWNVPGAIGDIIGTDGNQYAVCVQPTG